MRIEGRSYTTIETNLVKRLVEVVLSGAEQAFRPLSPVTSNLDWLETTARSAGISRPANAAILVRLRIDMEDRGGNVELLLPYATIEPIRDVLLQMFMGEKFGRDPIWEGHLATEIGQAEIAVDAVLYEAKLPLKQLMRLEVTDTLSLELRPHALVTVPCVDATLTERRMRLGSRRRGGERSGTGRAGQLRAGEVLRGDLARSGIGPPPVRVRPPPASFPDPKAVAAAAQAFSDRASQRARGCADGLAA